MKVLFFQRAHGEDDDRVYYHQQRSLEQAGHTCFFACKVEEVTVVPDIVICDTPLAIWMIRRKLGRRVRVVYDITEWYPSKKNLCLTPFVLRPFKWLSMVLASYWAGWSSDSFVFGEYYKGLPFRILFPWKQYTYLPYYPDLQYIPYRPAKALGATVRLLYAGSQTREKGYYRVQELVALCREQMPDREFVLTNINGLSFRAFCEEIGRHDIFLDLRDADAENTRCLPIKLFYYLAAGRPVIYSDLRAIRRGVPEIVEDSLVAPNDLGRAAEIVCAYVADGERYTAICARNRQLAEGKYNWELVVSRWLLVVGC